MASNCNINTTHCENCGSTDYEDLHTGDQGYTACCNELTTDRQGCRGHHMDDDASAELDAQCAKMYRDLVARKVNKPYALVAQKLLGSSNHFDAVDACDRHNARR